MRVRLVEYAECMGGLSLAYDFLVKKCKGKRQLGKTK
jgi:hypothetical protein